MSNTMEDIAMVERRGVMNTTVTTVKDNNLGNFTSLDDLEMRLACRYRSEVLL